MKSGKQQTIITLFFFLFFVAVVARAQVPPQVSQPAVSQPLPEPSISISPDEYYPFEEILYIEGRSVTGAIITVTLQKQGEKPVKFTTKTDSNGEWVVAEKTYLSSGNWEVRARSQVGTQISDWSNPRVIRSIVTGVNIFGLNVKYVVIVVILVIFLIVIALMFVYFMRRIRRLKEGLFAKQLHDTEDRFHRGIAEIRKDLMEELKILTMQAQNRPLNPEEIERKDHILRELDELERTVNQDMGNMSNRE